MEALATELSRNEDEERFDRLTDQRRRLASIKRELASSDSAATQNAALSPTAAVEASSAYASWESEYGGRITALRDRVEKLLPLASLPSDYAAFGEEARMLLRSEHKRLADRAEQARLDIERLTKTRGELEVSQRQRATIDEEISRLPKTAGSLGAVLSELSSYIDGDVCPVASGSRRITSPQRATMSSCRSISA